MPPILSDVVLRSRVLPPLLPHLVTMMRLAPAPRGYSQNSRPPCETQFNRLPRPPLRFATARVCFERLSETDWRSWQSQLSFYRSRSSCALMRMVTNG